MDTSLDEKQKMRMANIKLLLSSLAVFIVFFLLESFVFVGVAFALSFNIIHDSYTMMILGGISLLASMLYVCTHLIIRRVNVLIKLLKEHQE